jgi:hypothetical protein
MLLPGHTLSHDYRFGHPYLSDDELYVQEIQDSCPRLKQEEVVSPPASSASLGSQHAQLHPLNLHRDLCEVLKHVQGQSDQVVDCRCSQVFVSMGRIRIGS